MAPDLGNYWWVPIVAAAIGGLLVPFVGYYRWPRNGPGERTTIHGSTVIDSSIARNVLAQLSEQVIQTRRLADAGEALLEIERARERHDERRREAEHENALRENAAMKRKLDDMKKGQR